MTREEITAETRLPASGDDRLERAGDSGAPATIGPFRVLRLLGEGGMGRVYLAEQGEPFNRQVAVKVLKGFTNSRKAVEKFEREQASLARMDHPGIAAVYESGITSHGQPYFAMAHIDGPELLDYCDDQRLTVDQRLDLFLETCRAVQHAHQKGVIHRDIKPSNVLVKFEDGRPRPILIDFGIARALSDDTDPGEATFAGTPRYMSPEQAMGKIPDVRTDIYGLSLLLYKLLTSSHPFEDRDAGLVTYVNALTRENPSPPSRVFEKSDKVATLGASRRRGTPRALNRRLRGDLDQIVLEGLARDPEDRYASVSDLIADIRAHLDSKPIRAGKSSAVDLMGKFLHRHRLAVALWGMVLLLLSSGLAITWMALRRAEAAELEARREAENNRATNEFLLGLFHMADVNQADTRGDITVREVLEKGAEDIRDAMPGDPIGRARLMYTIARAFYASSGYEQASELSAEAARLQEAHGTDPRELAAVLVLHGIAERNAGRISRADGPLLRGLEIQRQHYPPRHPIVLDTLNKLATTYFESDREALAEPILAEVITAFEAMAEPSPTMYSDALNTMGICTYYTKGPDAARPYFERALEIRRGMYDGAHPDIAQSLNNLGLLYISLERYDEAEESILESIDQWTEILGPDSNRLGNALRSLAELYQNLDRNEEAEKALRRAHAIMMKAYPNAHPHQAGIAEQLADFLIEQGRVDEGIPFLEQARDLYLTLEGPDSDQTREIAERLETLSDN